jgi:alpha-galactosidase
MLQVGNGLTESEDLSHFSMWCMLAAPLLAGNDLTKMTPYVRSVLLHDELIAINQDVLVSQAVVAKEGGRSTSKLDQGWQL